MINNECDSYYDLGRYEEAIKCYNKAIETNPSNEEAWFTKALCLDNLGRYEEAIECYKKAEEISNSLARRFRT